MRNIQHALAVGGVWDLDRLLKYQLGIKSKDEGCAGVGHGQSDCVGP